MLSKILNLLILSSLFTLSPIIASGYQWPISSFNSQHPITGVLGEYRPDHLHRGIDIGEGIGTEVYPVVNGTVTEIGTTVQEKEKAYVKIRGENGIFYDYVHIEPNSALQVGSRTIAGQTLLGTILNPANFGSTMKPHLHFEENNGGTNSLRSGGLTPYSDTSDPTVNWVKVVQQGSGDPFPERNGMPLIFGQVDIKANAKDAQSNGSSIVAPYKIGYEVKDSQNNSIVSPTYKIEFDAISDNDSVSLVYDTSQSTISNYVYWVTNKPDANEYWDTTNLSEGTYTIYVMTEDIKGNEDTGSITVYADRTLPTVVSVAPTGVNVSVTTGISATFSEAMDTDATAQAFSISPADVTLNSPVWSNGNRTVTFSLSKALKYKTTYTITISTSACDIAHNQLAQAYQWNFTTKQLIQKVEANPRSLSFPPANSQSTITYTLNGNADSVIIEVYNVDGNMLACTIDNPPINQGQHSIPWDGRWDETSPMNDLYPQVWNINEDVFEGNYRLKLTAKAYGSQETVEISGLTVLTQEYSTHDLTDQEIVATAKTTKQPVCDIHEVFGNGDLDLDAGESVEISVTMRNKALETLTGYIDGYSEPMDEPDVVYDSHYYLIYRDNDDIFEGPISPDKEKKSSCTFWADVLPDTPLGQEMELFVKFESEVSAVDTFKIEDVNLDLNAKYHTHQVEDASNITDGQWGDNDQSADPGELIGIPVWLKNEGYSNMIHDYSEPPYNAPEINYAHNVKAILTTSNPYIKHIFDTTEDFGSIGSEKQVPGLDNPSYGVKGRTAGNYNFLIASNAPQGEITFNLQIKDDVTDVDNIIHNDFYTTQRTFNVIVQGIKDTLAPLIDSVEVVPSPKGIFRDGESVYFNTKILDGSDDIKTKINVLTPDTTSLDVDLLSDSKGDYEGWFEKLKYHWGPFTLNELKDGTYKINSLIADDNYGNISTPKPVNVNVEIDTKPPIVEIGSLTSDIFAGTVYNDAGYQLLTGTITISGRAWDKHFGTYTLEYAQGINPPLDWKLIVSSTLPQKDMGTLATWNTLALPDGTYTLRLTATDLVNHSSVTTKIIEIDNTNPTAIITQPGFSQAIALPEVDICGTAWDKNFKEFKLKYCQGILNEHNPNPTWYEIITKDTSVINGTLTNWNTSNLIDGGIYTLELTVTDKLDHQNSQIRAVRVDTTGPEITLAESIKTNVIGYNISEAGMVTINIYQVNPVEYPDIESFFQDTPPYSPVWDWTEEVHLGKNEVIWSGKDKDNIELPDSGTYTAYYLSLKGIDEASKESKLAYSQILKKGLPKIDSLTLPLEFDFQTNPMLYFSFISEIAPELEAIVVNDEGRLTQLLGSPTTSGNNNEITYQYGWDGRNIYGFMVLSGTYTLKIRLKDVDGNVVLWDGIKENRFIQITTPPLPPIIDYGSPTYQSTPPIPVTNSNPIIQIEKKVIFPTVPIYGSQDIISGNLTRFAWVFPIKCMEFIEMATNTCNSNAYIWDGRDIPPAKGDGSGRREASIASGGLFPTGDYDYVNYNNKLEYVTHSQVTLATDTLPVKIKGVCEVNTPPDNPIFDLDMTLDGYIKGYLLCVYDSKRNLIGTARLNPLPPQQEFGTWGDGSGDIEKRNWTKMIDKITYQSPLNLKAGKYIVELTSLDIAGNATKSVKEVSYQRSIFAEIGGTVIGDIGSDTSIKSIELVIPPQILEEINWVTSTIQITPATSTPELEPFFDYLDKIYNVAPKGLKFSPGATLRLTYLDFNNNDLIETDQNYDGIIGVQMDADPEIEGVKIETGEIVNQNYGLNEEQNIKVEQLGIFYLSEQGIPEYIGGIVDRQNKTIEAKIEHTSDYAALVKKDMTPPITTIIPSIINGSYTIPTATFSLSAIDPMGTTNEVVSGTKTIKYAIDNPEPDIVYVEPFTLPLGTHTIYYQAVDNAGNAEEVKNLKVLVVDRLLVDSGINLQGIFVGSAAWGDYDNDGDLDLALTGRENSGQYISKIYRNDSGVLIEDTTQNLPGVSYSSIAWGDYDNDSDLDLALTGKENSGQCISKIYRNDSGVLIEDTTQNLYGVSNSSIAWGDYDNDGDLDLVLTGSGISKVYKNELWKLIEDTTQNLIGVSDGSVAWGDYDNDGDLDLVLTGSGISKVYKNESGKLIEDTTQNLVGVSKSSVAWGDYDNDGDLDLALTGRENSGQYISKIYRNDSGVLIEDTTQNLYGVSNSSIAWGDYDNDGDLDLAITGSDESFVFIGISKIYMNTSGKLVEDTTQELLRVSFSSIVWGDIDSDGNLDLVLTGISAIYSKSISPKEIMDLLNLLRTEGNKDITLSKSFYAASNLYKNYGVKSNTSPSLPTQFSSNYTNGKLTFSWNAGSDTETTEKGLYYNIRIGTAPGKEDVVTGKYGSPLFGNYLLKQKSLTLNLPPGTYYWAVQAIDTGIRGSEWSAEQIAVTANITLVSPHSGTVGTIVTIKGDGYLQTELIRIDFGTIMSIAIATTDALGSFVSSFTVQTQPFGIYTISATGFVVSARVSFSIRGNIVFVSPTSGLRGTNVTISGNGYSAIEDIVVDFGKTKTIATCISSEVGSFSVTFTVDTQPAGTTTILVRGISSNEGCYSYFVITLKPKITLVSPAMGTVGSIVELAGAGFDLNEAIAIDFGKSLTIATTTTDEFGAFSGNFKVDTQGYGTTTIVTRGLTSGQNAVDTFIIRGNIVLVTPTSGLIGTKVTVAGNGFAALERVTIGFGRNPTIATVLSTAQGTFTTTFTADTQPGCGTITVSAKGKDCVAYSWFKMIGRITIISPQQGTIGTVVTVRGDGFAASELIYIDFGTNPTIAVILSDGLGRFTAVFTADTQPGCGTITVSAKGKDCVAYSWFKMIGRITIISPQQGIIGTVVTVRGDGFAASE
ncbi:MAG: FG-GAP-like repeat-containing protein, partial [bacterium]